MTPLLLGLSAYAVAFALLGPRLLHACAHQQRAAPRFGLALWTALPTSWIVAVLAVGLAATAQLSGGLGLAGLLHACLRALQVILGVHHPDDAPAALALCGSLTILIRLGTVAYRQARHDHKQRKAHRRGVSSSMQTVHRGGRLISIVDSPTPAAYCVPGRRSAIVLTTGTLRELPARQVDAVITHEHAHLRGRHHLFVAWGTILATAFPFIPLLRSAPHELARLVEWLADDQAGRRHGRPLVARALATMAAGPHSSASPQPEAALTATGSNVLDRVRRLIEPQTKARGARWPASTAIMAPILVLTATTAVLLPAVTADPAPLCQGQQPPTPISTRPTPGETGPE